MKNFKFIVAMIAMVFMTMALQTANSQVATLKYADTYYEYTGTAADTIGVADSTWSIEIIKRTDSKVYPSIEVSFDLTDGGDTVDVFLQRKLTSFGTYANVDTVQWTGAADGTVSLEYGTSVPGDYFKIFIRGTNDEIQAKILNAGFKFVE